MLCGPTATGKTSLSLALAKALDGEIVCADSMQIYRGLPIGTAQPTAGEQRAAVHHLVGFLPPEERFSVAQYQQAAGACIRDIAARGRVPLLVGGTGLYIDSVVKGVRFTEQNTDLSVRQRLEQRAEAEGMEALYAELCRIDPPCAAALHPHNRTRVLRALELYEQTGRTMTQQLAASLPAEPPYRAVVLGLTFPDRQLLYDRADARVDAMLRAGLLDEARTVYEHRAAYQTAAQAIGYKEFFPFFAGQEPLAACTARLKQATRNYAKRQLTWFRRTPGLRWLDAGAADLAAQALACWKEG